MNYIVGVTPTEVELSPFPKFGSGLMILHEQQGDMKKFITHTMKLSGETMVGLK